MESIRISISKDTHRAFFSRWKTGSSHNWNKHFDNTISVKRRSGEEVEEPWEKVHLQNKANLQLKSPFISCTGARSWTDTQFITLSAGLLGLTQIELKYAWHTAVKAFFHALAQSQTFHKVEGKGKGAVGVLFPVFYHQDEYDPLPFLICKTSHEITQG